jgi:hypothetical protein
MPDPSEPQMLRAIRYVVVSPDKTIRGRLCIIGPLTQSKPTTKGGEQALKLNFCVPETLFREKIPTFNLTMSEEALEQLMEDEDGLDIDIETPD